MIHYGDRYTKELGVHQGFDEDADKEGPELFDEEPEATLFHIGSYSLDMAKKLICKQCGGDQFNVGQNFRYTAIRCVTCEWEACVHD